MIELELLGLHPDGDRLSLNDDEGNRYILPITDDLRAALRKDRLGTGQSDEPKRITPREIQAHFRAGLTVAEVSELSSLPPSQLSGLAHPIFAERQYTSDLARQYRQGQELGGMTLEELVVSRLVPRGVSAEDIEWDAYRESGQPWTLRASYTISEKDQRALWRINAKAQAVHALNDEATWLTETQIPAPTSPWRPLNTPSMEADAARPQDAQGAKGRSSDPKITALDARPAAAGKPVSIDDVLASLDSQRGQVRPMPDDEVFEGAHPAHSAPEDAVDATILAFPKMSDSAASEASNDDSTDTTDSARPSAVGRPADSDNGSSSEPGSSPSAETPVIDDDASRPLPGQQEIPLDVKKDEAKSTGTQEKSKKRRNRPSMPSWDEIVFGYNKND